MEDSQSSFVIGLGPCIAETSGLSKALPLHQMTSPSWNTWIGIISRECLVGLASTSPSTSSCSRVCALFASARARLLRLVVATLRGTVATTVSAWIGSATSLSASAESLGVGFGERFGEGFLDLLLRFQGIRGEGRLHGLFWFGCSSLLFRLHGLVASASWTCCFGFMDLLLRLRISSCVQRLLTFCRGGAGVSGDHIPH